MEDNIVDYGPLDSDDLDRAEEILNVLTSCYGFRTLTTGNHEGGKRYIAAILRDLREQ